MLLFDLLKSAGEIIPDGTENTEISGICSDSRRVQPGNIFVCVNGISRDGHTFISEAVAGGASCVITLKGSRCDLFANVVYISVLNTRATLARLYNAWYGHPASKLKLIGVTGTNGKTTVSTMLAFIIQSCGHRCGLIGTNGCRLGAMKMQTAADNPTANMTTPDPGDFYRIISEMEKLGAEYIVSEISSHAIVQDRIAPLWFDVAVFTNLTPEHLDLHGSMENYFYTKKRLFDKCRSAVINTGDPYGRRLHDSPETTCAKICCSPSPGADYSFSDVIGDIHGVEYKLHSRNCSERVRVGIPGGFNVINSLEAFAAARELGFGCVEISRAISRFPGVEGRMQSVLPDGADFSVIIDYAHTPDALENLLVSVYTMKKESQGITLLFGCGGDRDRTKRRVMGNLASKYADMLIITSDNSRSESPNDIISEIMTGVNKEKPYAVIPDRAEAIEYAVSNAKKGEIILLAGKGHEKYQIDSEGRHYFSEHDIVLEAYRKRLP